MKTKIGVVRSSTEQEVKSKKFNIYLGISLGNKWFTKENIREHVLWALKYTKERVGILIADTLHAINYEVRNRKTLEKSIKKSLKEGDKFEKIIHEILTELSEEERKLIEIIRWEDVKKDPFIKELTPFFYKEFETNKPFREEILKIVRGFTKNEERNFNEEEIRRLCDYILSEIPEILCGFNHNGIYYNCYLHPQDTYLNLLMEKIQNKEIFPEFHEKIGMKKAVFVELEVLEDRKT